jgi:hypothetical protein
MLARLIAWFLVLAASPALGQEMNAEQALRFVSGKLFAFNCLDGSRGAGRIYADGSVIGNIQSSAAGPVQPVWLPPGTLKMKGQTVCAWLKGLSFEPCFTVIRTSDRTFRGSVNGMAMIAYCDFAQQRRGAGSRQGHGVMNPRPMWAGRKRRNRRCVRCAGVMVRCAASRGISPRSGCSKSGGAPYRTGGIWSMNIISAWFQVQGVRGSF